MTAEVAKRRIETFVKRLGIPHLHLAYHAAFPIALTPDLLYRLWATFQKDIQGQPLGIPWIAVSNILLSGLCREIDDELYQLDAAVRSELLNRLKSDRQFGTPRLQQLSEFLIEYTEQQLRLESTNPDIQEFAKTQRLAALAYIKPDEAARKLAMWYREILLSASSSTSRERTELTSRGRTELMQMAALVEASADSLKDFESLRIYARSMASFARGELEKAANQLHPVIDEQGQIRVSNIILPIPEQIEAKQPAFQHPRPELTEHSQEVNAVPVSNVILPIPEQIKAKQPAFQHPSPELTEYSQEVNAVSISSNSQTLVNANSDRTIKSEAFKWHNSIYNTLITLFIVFNLGTIFSLVFYKPLSESNNLVARQFAEAIYNLLSNVGIGIYPEALPVRSTSSQTPQELGQEKYLAIVSRARNILSIMPADRQIKFTLGVHTPIRTSTSNQSQWQIKKLEAIGLVSRSGELIPLTVGDLQEMFDKKGDILYKEPEAQPGEVAVIDLLVYNTQTNQVFLMPNVRFTDIFRDALNATLNGGLKSNKYEINNTKN